MQKIQQKEHQQSMFFYDKAEMQKVHVKYFPFLYKIDSLDWSRLSWKHSNNACAYLE